MRATIFRSELTPNGGRDSSQSPDSLRAWEGHGKNRPPSGFLFFSPGGLAMPFMLAIWKNETVSVFKVSRDYTALDVFSELDEIGSPFDTKAVYELRSSWGSAHATTVFRTDDHGKKTQEWSPVSGSLRQVSFDWEEAWRQHVEEMTTFGSDNRKDAT
jgi:hypothetical protein